MSLKPVYITFLGVGGAGKSTIANDLMKALVVEGRSVASYREFRELGRFSRHILPVAYAIKSKESIKEFINFVFLFFKLLPFRPFEMKGFTHGVKTHFVRNFVVQTVPAEVYVFEEDTMTPFLNIHTAKFAALDLLGLLTRLFSYFSKCTPVVVSVEVSVDVAVDRAFQQAHRKLFPTSFYENVLANQKKFMEVLGGGYPDLIQITVDGTAPLRDNVELILSTLKNKSAL